MPLGESQVDPKYGEMLMKTGYSGPISLHVEYLEGNPKDAAVLKGFREAHLRDIEDAQGVAGVGVNLYPFKASERLAVNATAMKPQHVCWSTNL